MNMFKKSKLDKEVKKRILEAAEEAAEKQMKFEDLSSRPLNYDIIEDLIRSAAQGVRIDVTLKDGSKLSIKQETPFDQYKDKELF